MALATDPKIDSDIGKYIRANAIYWFEHELREYPAVNLDLDVLGARYDRIVPMAGRESRGYPCYEVNVELGKKLGRKLIELPGGHIGFLTHTAEGSHANSWRLLRKHKRNRRPVALQCFGNVPSRRSKPWRDFSGGQAARLWLAKPYFLS